MSQISQFRKSLENVLHNPVSIQRRALRLLREIHADKLEIYDPSNPLMQLYEISATGVSSLFQGFENRNRKLYPYNAMTEDELYLHMSDKDFVGRFALPSDAHFQMLIQLDDLRNNLVDDIQNGYKKIVIPRNSMFSASGVPFSISYPIEIRELRHGGLSVVWDVNQPSPVGTVSTNLISHSISRVEQADYLNFYFPVKQYEITSNFFEFSPSSRLYGTSNFVDQFYLARVWISTNTTNSGADDWVEVRTTHTDQVYDPETITAVLKVNNSTKTVEVQIPVIYVNKFGLTGKVRVDVYTTQGYLNMDLGNLSGASFTHTWKGIDPKDQNQYTSNLSKLQAVEVWSSSRVNGGRNSLPLEELRQRVIYNRTGPKEKPITPDQIETVLEDKGYEIVKNIDVVTNRVFLATRQLPAPQNNQLITSAALSIQTAILNAEDIITTGTVIDNNTSVTITPETLFQNRNGRTYIVPKAEADAIRLLPNDRQASIVTNGNYYYTPWHYVLEMQEDFFDVRAYHLDMPTAKNKTFISENSSTLLSCSVTSYSIVRTATGYLLEIGTTESDALKAIDDSKVFAQLSFRPQKESSNAYQNGTLVGKSDDGSRIYQFNLNTNFNVTSTDGLELTDFFMFDMSPKIFSTDLTNLFDVHFATSEFMPSTWEPNNTDTELGHFLLPGNVAGIIHERIELEFGKALKNLWVRSRTIPGEEKYETYPFDVPAYYLEDVYELGVDGTPVLVDGDGKPYFNILHHKGDPVFESDGVTPVYRHRKGDIVYDAGEPVPISPRKLHRQIDFMLVDGVYFFSTDKIVQDYRVELVQILVDWIVNDLGDIVPDLLEETKIYFYPKTTTGLVEVMYGAGLTTSLPAQQSFYVSLHVDDKVVRDEKLLEQLSIKSIEVINAHLAKDVFAISDVVVDLKSVYGQDALDVRVTGLGGQANNFAMVSIINLMDRLSLRKRLLARNDGILAVEEDITMEFIRHRLNIN